MSVTREIYAIKLSVLLVCTPILAQEEKQLGMETNIEYEKGLMDGKKAGKEAVNQGPWFLGGCIGGFIPVVGWGASIGPAFGAKVEAPDILKLKKNPSYLDGFQKGYQKGVRNTRVKNAAIGVFFTTVVATIVIFVIFPGFLPHLVGGQYTQFINSN